VQPESLSWSVSKFQTVGPATDLVCCNRDGYKLTELLECGQTDNVIKLLVEWLQHASNYLDETQPLLGNTETVTQLIDQHKVSVYIVSLMTKFDGTTEHWPNHWGVQTPQNLDGPPTFYVAF